MNHPPKVSPSVLNTVLVILFVELTIGFAIYQFRGLWIAVANAAARYDAGVENLAAQQIQSD
jgi:hypothetical protein